MDAEDFLFLPKVVGICVRTVSVLIVLVVRREPM